MRSPRTAAILTALAVVGCAHSPAGRHRQLDSRFAFRFNAMHAAVGSAEIRGFSPVVVTVTVAAVAGASIACARVTWEVDDTEASQESDCIPEPDAEAEGGVLVRVIPFGPGPHMLRVTAQEPGRRPVGAWREVEGL